MCYIIYFTKTKSNKKTKNMFKFIKQILPGLVMAVALFTMVSFANSTPTFAADLVPSGDSICGGDCPVTGPQTFEGENENSIVNIMVSIARFLTYVGVGLSVLFMVWGGIRYITSNGNEETATKAKQILINATIGLVVSIVAFTIVNILASLLQGNVAGSIISS